MTFATKWNNVEPMDFIVPKMVMIFFGFFSTLVTLKFFGSRNVSASYGKHNGLTRLEFFRPFFHLAFVFLFYHIFYFFWMSIIPTLAIQVRAFLVSKLVLSSAINFSLSVIGIPFFEYPALTGFTPGFILIEFTFVLVFVTGMALFIHRFILSKKQSAIVLRLPFCRRNKQLHKTMALYRQIKTALFLRQPDYNMI